MQAATYEKHFLVFLFASTDCSHLDFKESPLVVLVGSFSRLIVLKIDINTYTNVHFLVLVLITTEVVV